MDVSPIMKKAILLSLVCCFFLSAKAQVSDLNDFYRPGAIWGSAWSSTFYPVYPRIFRITSDTIVDGYTFHLISYSQAGVTNQFLGGIRVDGQKVYFRNLSSDTIYTSEIKFVPGVEYMMYDYDVKVGDVLPWKRYYQGVSRIDTVNFNGTLLRRYHFYQMGMGSYHDYWIEGIGSNLGFWGSYFLPYYQYNTWERTVVYCANNYQYQFDSPAIELYDGKCHLKSLGVNTLQENDGVSLFPNPSRDDIHLRSENAALSQVSIYDLQGREVYQKKFSGGTKQIQLQMDLAPGVYLIKISLENGMVSARRLIRN